MKMKHWENLITWTMFVIPLSISFMSVTTEIFFIDKYTMKTKSTWQPTVSDFLSFFSHTCFHHVFFARGVTVQPVTFFCCLVHVNIPIVVCYYRRHLRNCLLARSTSKNCFTITIQTYFQFHLLNFIVVLCDADKTMTCLRYKCNTSFG